MLIRDFCFFSHEYKEFHDLKGHKFAYSEPYSMSGAYIVLDELKNQKTNSSFFGDIFQSGKHYLRLFIFLL